MIIKNIKFIITFSLLAASAIWLLNSIGTLFYKVNRTKSWVKTNCIIESRVMDYEVLSNYDILPHYKIKYKYEYKGIAYCAAQYNALEESYIRATHTEEEREAFKKENPFAPEKKTVCFVNPDNPSQAVLSRDFTLGLFFRHLSYPTAATFLSLIFFIYREQLGKNINFDD